MAPPKKKQKLGLKPESNKGCLKNIEHSIEEDQRKEKITSSKKRKRSKLQVPCHEMVQFKQKDFKGILQMYIEDRTNVSNETIVFKTREDDRAKFDGNHMFITVCEAGELSGEGCGISKQKSKSMACLDIIQKLGLVPVELHVDTMARVLPKNPKRVKPLLENGNYLQGNFKGLLQEYLAMNDPEDELIFKTSSQVYVTTCRTKNGKYQGRGEAPAKKKSVHLACLDAMINMGLLTKEQHLGKHSPLEKSNTGDSSQILEKIVEVEVIN